MYDESSRLRKAIRIIKILRESAYIPLKKLKLLDIGASTGIIDNYLSSYLAKVTGVDIDVDAISYAKKNFKKNNLTFAVADAMELPFPDNSFDIVICAHVYEHVPDPAQLFQEVFRVLKPKGLCYLAAVHSWWPIEPHHNLPFLALLPKNLANIYMRLTKKGTNYYENLMDPLSLEKSLRNFQITKYNQRIIRNPEKFGFEDTILSNQYIKPFSWIFSWVSDYFSPTLFWILEKK